MLQINTFSILTFVAVVALFAGAVFVGVKSENATFAMHKKCRDLGGIPVQHAASMDRIVCIKNDAVIIVIN